ncbi:hypothetical protein ACJRO7_007795 [Eucalyptus globulus]|uniref:(+)-neomenthol dehydrogenase-like n=1 Tax=Eucalyptus globulus TaxID=34317 RepID=A0ABD3IPF2_EUCGL
MDGKVDGVVKAFLEDFENGSLEAKGWPAVFLAHIILKAAMNAYTRILAKTYPNFIVNSMRPGFVKTGINFNTSMLLVQEGAETPVKWALLPDGGPSGCFFVGKKCQTSHGR